MNLPLTSKKSKLSSCKILHSDESCLSQVASTLGHHFAKLHRDDSLVIVCIGTDRSTGDSLGPMVGTKLKEMNIAQATVYGTLDDPVHAMNLEEVLYRIHRQHARPFIVGIDACLGQVSSIGCIQIGDGPVKPGAGVNKELPPVGHIHITGIVNVGGFMEYFVLQNTRLSLVMKMSAAIAVGLQRAILATSPRSSLAALD
ncbi:spore protease YyaC [Marinicrinis sediminis]|uniref:Spore protease YyaC n=1 Tax=Marinicrinis sediminis TaxID=1652465 RepID=A0ABW5RB22_9BACL